MSQVTWKVIFPAKAIPESVPEGLTDRLLSLEALFGPLEISRHDGVNHTLFEATRELRGCEVIRPSHGGIILGPIDQSKALRAKVIGRIPNDWPDPPGLEAAKRHRVTVRSNARLCMRCGIPPTEGFAYSGIPICPQCQQFAMQHFFGSCRSVSDGVRFCGWATWRAACGLCFFSSFCFRNWVRERFAETQQKNRSWNEDQNDAQL